MPDNFIISILGICSWGYFMIKINNATKDLKVAGKWIFYFAPYLLFNNDSFNIDPKKKKDVLIGFGLFISILAIPFIVSVVKFFI